MSDQSQGHGWWQASDGKWYPPETHPDYRPAQIAPLVARGVTGTITFDGTWVSIARTGVAAKVTVGGGTKQIPVRSISGVQLKPASVARGYIQFTIPGGEERRSRGTIGGGATAAARDENSVMFTRSQEPAFRHLHAAVMEAIARS